MDAEVTLHVRPDPDQLLNFSCELGRQLLQNGAEIYRVEDSIQRLLTAYGYARAEIFAIPFCIILTIQEGERNYTKSVRTQTVANNLRRLNELNALCRRLCREVPAMEECWQQMESILREPVYPTWVGYCAHGVVAAFFTLFWGGVWGDALLAFPCGLLVKLAVSVTRRVKINAFFTNFLACMLLALGPEILICLGVPIHADKMIIGTIMLLVPGIAITNGMRDVLVGDFLTALTRFAEVVIVAMGITTGVAAAITVTRFFLGGLM